MIKFNAGSLRVTILAMEKLSVTEQQAASAAAKSAGLILHGLIKQNMSLRDHSQEDLDAADNPYAKRHASITIHGAGTKALVHPAFRIHKQSGRMLAQLNSGPTDTGIGWRVKVDASSPYMRYVIEGTKVMHGRDVLVDTAAAPDVQRRLLKDIVRTLGKRLRTQAALRVGGK